MKSRMPDDEIEHSIRFYSHLQRDLGQSCDDIMCASAGSTLCLITKHSDEICCRVSCKEIVTFSFNLVVDQKRWERNSAPVQRRLDQDTRATDAL